MLEAYQQADVRQLKKIKKIIDNNIKQGKIKENEEIINNLTNYICGN